jgi:hypothetical protein
MQNAKFKMQNAKLQLGWWLWVQIINSIGMEND